MVTNGSRCGRWLDCSPAGVFAQAGLLDTNGNIGATGTTVYVSFLQQPSSPAQFYEFEFHRGNLGDAGRIGGIGNDATNATTVNLRAPGSVQTPLGLGNANVNFYVVRIDFKPGNDDVTVYRNPAGVNEADNDPVLTMPAVADLSFNGISIGAHFNGVSVQTDEIRIGQTWSSVLGNPPAFMLQPTNQFAYPGQSVTLAALAQSSLPVNYQWLRGGVPLSGKTNSTLTLANAQPGDVNQYSVTASNALGTATSAAAALAVQPAFLTPLTPAALSVGPGSNLVLNAAVSGAPPLSLQWYRNGAPVAGATNVPLTLGGNGYFDAGQYLLVSSNAYGSVTSSVVNVSASLGGLLAYEGFHYGQTTNDIAGATGGFGWAGAWVNVSSPSSQSFSNSLLAGAGAPAGYDAHSWDGYLYVTNSSRKGRFFDCSATGPFAQRGLIDANGNIGADGTTIYISFLQQPNATTKFYEFELKRGNLSDSGRIGGIGNDTGDTHVHLRSQYPAGGTTTFYDLGPGNTGVNSYVLRINFQSGHDVVSVFRNPTSLTEPGTPSLVVSNLADMSFNGISFGAYLNGVTVSHDEVRVGLTWADVIGGNLSQLQISKTTSNVANLALAASPKYSYQILAATNLTGPWSNLASLIPPAAGVNQFVDAGATSAQKFYRATNGVIASDQASDIVFADFEGTNYGAWTTTGTAFGSGPAQGTLPGQQAVSGYQGSGLVNSYNGRDASTGTLTSPSFVISQPYIDFLIGGGNNPGRTCMNLLVNNVVVRAETGANSETLTAQQWDVSAFLGQTATLQIVDSATGGWGHILIDQIVFSAAVYPPLSETMALTNTLLNLPVKNSATKRRVTVTVGGNTVRDFNIPLADGTPDWWAFVDVSAFSNQTATVSVDSLTAGSTGLSSALQTNGIVGATNLYAETLRPQIHFSTRRGWLNDANGMFFYHGQYHLYYQHDPFSWDGAGLQRWWGHAASADMVRWQELPEGIYSHAYGDQVFSGSAVVDTNNTSGFKTGTNDVIVAAYTSTARGECIAYSNDGGLTFTDYTGNPVLSSAVHKGRDPHLLWYAPSNYWVMAVFDNTTGTNGIAFYTSTNLKNWKYASRIDGFYECPDLFQLPVDNNTNNLMWELNDASSGYMLGQFNGTVFTPSTAKLTGNSGSAFYGSQTFSGMAPGDNRKVRIGWAIISMTGMPFNQMMYFPTELSLRTIGSAVQLCYQPVSEATNLYLKIGRAHV